MRLAYSIGLILALSTGAWAANSGGNSSGAKICKSGYVYDAQKKTCVSKSSANVTDKDLLTQAWALAKSGRFEDGRDLFGMVHDREPGNPVALNGLGYTNRKLGNFDIAFGYYQQALHIDPDYLDAREYLGEGYAVAGKINLARAQLVEIAHRGGTGIEQYAELSEAIDKAVKSASAK